MDGLSTHVEYRTGRLEHEAHIRRLTEEPRSAARTRLHSPRRLARAIVTTLIALTLGAGAYAAAMAPDRGADGASARVVYALVRPIVAHR